MAGQVAAVGSAGLFRGGVLQALSKPLGEFTHVEYERNKKGQLTDTYTTKWSISMADAVGIALITAAIMIFMKFKASDKLPKNQKEFEDAIVALAVLGPVFGPIATIAGADDPAFAGNTVVNIVSNLMEKMKDFLPEFGGML